MTNYDELLEKLDKGAAFCGYTEAFDGDWRQLCAEAAQALRESAAVSPPGELGGNEILRLLDARIAQYEEMDARKDLTDYGQHALLSFKNFRTDVLGAMRRRAASAQAKPTRERIAETVGWYLACVVSGNNQPDMSGDPRKRIPPGRRRHFDDACLACADAILALLQASEAKETGLTEEITNAIIAGIGADDDPVGQSIEIIANLKKVGYAIVKVSKTGDLVEGGK